MESVEAKRSAQEVGRAFAGTANPAELDDPFRIDVEFIADGDDLVSDGIMPTTLAEGGLGALIVGSAETDRVGF